MNKISSTTTKDIIIIFFIIIVFLAVILVFWTELMKNKNIKDSKINFYFVKEELIKTVFKCKDKDQNWIFGIPCNQIPTKIIISYYFNKTKKLINPYDGLNGVEGNAGSVKVDIKNKLIILSVDFDASGGIDIVHTIYFN